MRCHSKGLKAPGLARKTVASLVLVSVLLTALPVVALAQSRDVTTTAVVTFTDSSNRNSPLLEAKATDAVALALQDSREFLVTAARDVDREMRALGVTPPLSVAQAIRLGRRLEVDSVTVGEIFEASVDERSGAASVKIEMRMVNVEAEEALDGANITAKTRGLAGWHGTEADALNEALRQASEQVVAKALRNTFDEFTAINDKGVTLAKVLRERQKKVDSSETFQASG